MDPYEQVTNHLCEEYVQDALCGGSLVERVDAMYGVEGLRVVRKGQWEEGLVAFLTPFSEGLEADLLAYDPVREVSRSGMNDGSEQSGFCFRTVMRVWLRQGQVSRRF